MDAIPIPRIELSTPTFDLVVENILFKLDAFLPSSIALEAHNSFSFSPYSATTTTTSTSSYHSTPTSPSTSYLTSSRPHLEPPPRRYTHFDERKHEFKVTLEGLHINVKDVGVFMKRKRKEKAIPLPVPEQVGNRVIEESMVDLEVGDEGITVRRLDCSLFLAWWQPILNAAIVPNFFVGHGSHCLRPQGH